MKVKSIVENDDGVFEFQVDLTAQQHAFLIEYALRDLVRKGLLPMLTQDNSTELVKVQPQSEENHLN